jgi:2-amino-4-hydroxy-6-hydroxymethyldihydropteridine diphosphokinase
MKTASTTEPTAIAVDAPRVLLMLGSNEAAEQRLDAALACLQRQFPVLARSQRHRSAAVDSADAPAYLNQALIIGTALDRDDLRVVLRAIEAQLGRRRPATDSRLCPIDIDALGRWFPAFEVWDTKSYLAEYARAPLQDLAFSGRQTSSR